MFTENFTLKFADQEIPEVYADILALEVELDEELAGMLRLRLNVGQSDGGFSYVDDDRIRLWTRVQVDAGFDGDTDPLFSGYITHIRPAFAAPPQKTSLEIWAIDNSVILDREEILKAWPAKKDSDIASEILTGHGFTASIGDQVEDTGVVHDEAVSTIIQRETDMRFLKRLALRNGFECYVDGDEAFFRSPQVDGEAQPLLDVDSGSLTRFSLEVNALVPAQVGVFQVDRANKEILNANAVTSDLRALGAQDAAASLAGDVPAGKVFLGPGVATGSEELATLCQGLFRRGEWFVFGEGEVSANNYGHVLKPRAPVTIQGMGELYSGIYYVTHVLHGFNTQGYVQSFRVKRNGLMPTGEEGFPGGGLEFP